jgi:hypothetical protein
VYAEDTIIIVGRNNINDLKLTVEFCTRKVEHGGLSSIGLTLSLHKTEILLWNGLTKREKTSLKFTLGGHTIRPKEAIKYLGVIVDSELIIEKCNKRFHSLRHYATTHMVMGTGLEWLCLIASFSRISCIAARHGTIDWI